MSDDKIEPGQNSLAPRASIQERITAFAMLDAMGEAATLAQKVTRLSLVGFAPGEIAAMLQTTPATVYQYLYVSRKRTSLRKG